MLPVWSAEIIASLITGSVTDQERQEYLSRLRNARLAEVDDIERILGIEMTTSEMRRTFKSMVRRIRYLEHELEEEKRRSKS